MPAVSLLFGVALLMTVLWAVFEVRVPLTGVAGLFGWGVLALRAEAVVIHDGGEEFVTQTPAIRWFALFMALATGLALLLWQWGDFPPEESDADTEVRIQRRIGGIPIKTIRERRRD